jgi:hypothetical protein
MGDIVLVSDVFDVLLSTDGGDNFAKQTLGDLIGSSTVAIASDGSTLYVGAPEGTSASMYCSSDHAKWKACMTGLPSPASVTDVVADIASPTTAYACVQTDTTTGAGLYKTTDSGASWSIVSTSNDCLNGNVVIDPNSSAHFVVANATEIDSSTDTGMTWMTMKPPGSISVRTVAFDPSTAGLEWFGDSGGGVYRYQNGTWTQKAKGIAALPIGAIAVDPTDPNTVYVSGDGITKSTDGGQTWGTVLSSIGGGALGASVAVDVGNRDYVYATDAFDTLWLSQDAGAHWTMGNVAATLVVANPTQPGEVFAFREVAMRSKLYGANFANVSTYAPSFPPVAAARGKDVYFVGTNQLVVSRDGGDTWTAQTSAPTCTALAIDSDAEGTVYCATTIGVLMSHDKGATFVPSLALGPNGSVAALTTIAGTAYAALFTGTGSLVYTTTDGGAHWTSVNADFGHISAIAAAPTNANVVYAGTTARGIYKTVTGGH